MYTYFNKNQWFQKVLYRPGLELSNITIQLKPALKSIKLKHSPTGCFVNRLVRGFCNIK